jgi:undecaprenyl-diphosphatase
MNKLVKGRTGIRLIIACAASTFLLIACATAAVAADATNAEVAPTGVSLTAFQAIILGLVEGATEYLPVSSTGHLIIVQNLLGLSDGDSDSHAADALAICIQGGAIFAVVLLYFARIRQMCVGMLGKEPNGLRLLRNLIIAFTPAAIIGLLFNDVIKEHLFGVKAVASSLLVGGLLILATAKTITHRSGDNGKELHEMSWSAALIIGLMQCCAFWPGFSRSLATILGAVWTGFRLSAAVEFSFLLGLTTLTAATAYEGLKHGPEMFSQYGYAMPLLALVVAFVAAALSIKFMIAFLNQFGLAWFGYYRIALAAACFYWLV